MSVPASHDPSGPIAAFIERHVRLVMEWIAERLASRRVTDDSIDWEDGEERDEAKRPRVL